MMKKIIYTIFVIVFLATYVIYDYNNHNISTRNDNEDTNTWVVIEQPVIINTWEILWARELLNYQLENWEWWKDYIIVTPNPEQPKINAKTSAENNERMRSYIWNNRITFDINTERKWYIMFVTTKQIKNSTNIFFWLDWKTIGRLDKTSQNKIDTEYENEFLYPLDHIDLVWNNNYRFTAETTWKDKLSINAVVWEDNNKIEKIIIFFR